jgi:hypothetical protein
VHAVLHAPQWLGFVDRLASQPFVAIPSQLPQPVAHDATAHTPPTHEGVASDSEHTWPHVPQLAGSICALMHPPPQATSGDTQLVAQVPAAQSSPDGQTLPHPPQLFLSI